MKHTSDSNNSIMQSFPCERERGKRASREAYPLLPRPCPYDRRRALFVIALVFPSADVSVP